MDIKEYKKIVEITGVFPNKVENFGLAYSWLGLIGELEEYKEAMNIENNIDNIIKEAGDVMWYLTAVCNNTNLSIENIVDKQLIKNISSKSVYLYSENIKKYYRDSKPIVVSEMESVLRNLYFNTIVKSLDDYNLDIELIMKTNYDKLIKRKEENKIKGDGDNR